MSSHILLLVLMLTMERRPIHKLLDAFLGVRPLALRPRQLLDRLILVWEATLADLCGYLLHISISGELEQREVRFRWKECFL